MEKLAIFGGEPISKKIIPIAKPVFSDKTIKDVSDVLKSGFIRQGPKTREFEERFGEKVGARYACAVSTGTAALHIAYLSTINPGDEVIVPSFTFFATASMVLHSRGKPVFADIDKETFLIDSEDVLEKITDRTKAIVPVHLFGNAADMEALNEIAEDHRLVIINDSAQAHGTEYQERDIGSYDTLNCYSFYPTKSMTTGEGGMITTNDEKLWQLAKLLRSHGDDGRYHHVALGLNYRMTEISAAIGLNQLGELEENLAKRRRIGNILRDSIKKIRGLTPQRIEDKVNPSYSYFSLTMDLSQFKCTRNQFVEAVRAENIDCAVHYPLPLSKQPAITAIMKPEACPVSEDVSQRIFSIPMHPELSDEDLRLIIRGIEKVSKYYYA